MEILRSQRKSEVIGRDEKNEWMIMQNRQMFNAKQKLKKKKQYQTVVIISRPLSDCHSESEQTKENLDVDVWRLYNPVICNYEKLN